jgi:peptide/nickel transport system substrate-binding protein
MRRLALTGAALLALLSGCGEEERGPVAISAIGSPPTLLNPNLTPLDSPSALLLEATAQGLVRFDSSGQIEPALAQRWIVSDDGLRYTFRIMEADWAEGQPVSAAQVTTRLRAAISASSRNPLKPLLASIDEIETMTDDVLEVSLASPRANFLQLLAQPEMAILRNERGTGRYRVAARPDGAALLRLPREEDGQDAVERPDVLLRGERAALAVARFVAGNADLVTGGSIGDLPIARAASPRNQALRFDPVFGLFGFAFERGDGPLGDASVRQALSMALDRDALVATLGVPQLQPRRSLLPPGIDELRTPAAPAWAASPLGQRRTAAARAVATATKGETLRLRVALPPGPGYRMLFARIRSQWRSIGVAAEPVALGSPADLRLIDLVAPGTMASWYLHSFACERGPVCSSEADDLMREARAADTAQFREDLLRRANQALEETSVFIPITAPVRWHLVSQRLTGFRTNVFGHHPTAELIAETD